MELHLHHLKPAICFVRFNGLRLQWQRFWGAEAICQEAQVRVHDVSCSGSSGNGNDKGLHEPSTSSINGRANSFWMCLSAKAGNSYDYYHVTSSTTSPRRSRTPRRIYWSAHGRKRVRTHLQSSHSHFCRRTGGNGGFLFSYIVGSP